MGRNGQYKVSLVYEEAQRLKKQQRGEAESSANEEEDETMEPSLGA